MFMRQPGLALNTDVCLFRRVMTDSNALAKDIYVLIHNIDGPTLRNKEAQVGCWIIKLALR